MVDQVFVSVAGASFQAFDVGRCVSDGTEPRRTTASVLANQVTTGHPAVGSGLVSGVFHTGRTPHVQNLTQFRKVAMVAIPAGDVQDADMSFPADLKLLRDTCSVAIVHAGFDEGERAPVEIRKRSPSASQAVSTEPRRGYA